MATSMLILSAASGLALGAGPAFFAGAFAANAHALWQIDTVDLDSPASCLAKFKSNAALGALLTAGIVLDRWTGITYF